MSAMFKVFPVEQGKYQFEFINSKGELMLVSPQFESQEVAEKVIQDVRVGSMISEQIATSKTPDGNFFFIIKDREGIAVAKSVLFDDEMTFNNGLHVVRDNACIADITYVDA